MPFVLEVLAGPSGGKTALIRCLAGRLTGKYAVLVLGNNDAAIGWVKTLAKVKGDRIMSMPNYLDSKEKRRFKVWKSFIFQEILLELDMIAHRAGPATIVLFEHGLRYTWAVEHYGGRASAADLARMRSVVEEPDLTIYLPATYEELRSREMSRMHWDEENVKRICDGLEEMYRNRKSGKGSWIRMPKGRTPDELADLCLPVILRAYEDYWQKLMSSKTSAKPASKEII